MHGRKPPAAAGAHPAPIQLAQHGQQVGWAGAGAAALRCCPARTCTRMQVPAHRRSGGKARGRPAPPHGLQRLCSTRQSFPQVGGQLSTGAMDAHLSWVVTNSTQTRPLVWLHDSRCTAVAMVFQDGTQAATLTPGDVQGVDGGNQGRPHFCTLRRGSCLPDLVWLRRGSCLLAPPLVCYVHKAQFVVRHGWPLPALQQRAPEARRQGGKEGGQGCLALPRAARTGRLPRVRLWHRRGGPPPSPGAGAGARAWANRGGATRRCQVW